MLTNIDDFIIDHVFQPVVDRLDGYVSCYQLAGFFFTGATLFHLVSGLALKHWVGRTIVTLWWSWLIIRSYRLDARPPSDVLPIERITGRGQRLALLMLEIYTTVLTISDYPSRWLLLEEATWWLMIVGLFLLACRRRPPRRQRAPVGWRWLGCKIA